MERTIGAASGGGQASATAAAEADAQTGPSFSISQLAAEFDVTPRALRFYESKGLLRPVRRGQARLYGHRDRARLGLILRGKRCGFSLDEIKELLDLYALQDGGITQMKAARGRFAERLKGLEAQRAEIDTAMDELKNAITVIDARLSDLAEAGTQAGDVRVIGYGLMPAK